MVTSSKPTSKGKVLTLEDAICLVRLMAVSAVMILYFMCVISRSGMHILSMPIGTGSHFVAAALPSPSRMQVVEQGLTPDMAIRACNNDNITSSILSRKISEAVDECAKKEVAQQKEKNDDDKDCVVIDTKRPARTSTSSSSSKRRRISTDSAASTGTTSSVSSDGAAKKKGTSPSIGNVFLTAPYFKRAPTHFQRKVQAKVKKLINEISPSPEKISKTATTLVS